MSNFDNTIYTANFFIGENQYEMNALIDTASELVMIKAKEV